MPKYGSRLKTTEKWKLQELLKPVKKTTELAAYLGLECSAVSNIAKKGVATQETMDKVKDWMEEQKTKAA